MTDAVKINTEKKPLLNRKNRFGVNTILSSNALYAKKTHSSCTSFMFRDLVPETCRDVSERSIESVHMFNVQSFHIKKAQSEHKD